jgi:putative membrane protein
MSSGFFIAGSVFVGLGAVIHVFIFWLESITWTTPSTWRRFGIRSQEDAEVVRPMAYNQGFYNGFLAVGAACGIILLSSPGLKQAGVALELFAALSMVFAATVLVVSTPQLARAAALQGALPLVGIVLLAIGLFAG